MARLKSLDVIEVDDPCPEDWDGMVGGGAVRFCQLCRMNVYDLTQITRAEATALVEETEGRLCVSFYRRADGTVVTSDCAPVRFAAMRRAARRSLAAASGLVASLLAFVLGLAGLVALRLGPKDTHDAVTRKLEVVAKAMVPAYVTVAEPEPEPEPEPERYPMRRGRVRIRH